MLTSHIRSRSPTRTIVEFCRFAREKGLSGSVEETLAALEAAATIGLDNPEELKFGLRASLCRSREDWQRFDECFGEFWMVARADRRRPSNRTQSGAQGHIPGVAGRQISPLMSAGGADISAEGEGAQAIAGASTRERLTKADFSTLSRTDMAVLEHLTLRLFKQMSRRMARRKKIGSSHGQVDLRRTIHRNISHGGDPITLKYRERRPRPHRLIMLLDISGSMSAYSLFLLKFLYALQKHFREVDTFLFSTTLVEITSRFRTRSLDKALQALSQQDAGWSGGTNIGGALRELNEACRRRMNTDTLFLVLSDGWDTGDPATLAAELAAIRRRVRKVIWLNPLLGLQDYKPVTRGMSAALPYIDVFAPAHNVESLLALENHL